MFQLYAIDKRTNAIRSAIGSPDTFDRCHNLKRAYSGTYQPRCWFAVLQPGLSIGHTIRKT